MTDIEKIAELISIVETTSYVLRGERTELAIENLASYIERKRKEIDDWS